MRTSRFGRSCYTFIALLLACLGHSRVAAEPPPAAPQAATMEQALALLAEAQRQFQGVRDYSCTVVKRERVRGKMMPENVMTLLARNRPFSVYLRWQAPRALAGQEVCYVAGANRGQMRVHPVGLAGIVGFVSLDPTDPRALEDNRHPVTEAGIGNLLDSVARQWELERRWNKTLVRIADGDFHGRPCTWIETLHPDRAAGSFYGYRCLLCLDRATRLPVHNAAYDWPQPGGDPGGDLLESYDYLDIRCNVGLTDETFKH